MTANYHTHTKRCRHASGTEREYIETAVSRGLTTLGFSDHTPQIFPNGFVSNFRMAPEETAEYFRTLRELRDEYADRIDIKIGFEAEYYPKIFGDLIDFLGEFEPDYLILGQHFIDNEYDTYRYSGAAADEKVLTDYVDQTLEAISTGKFSVFAHPDLINYTKDDKIYECEMRRLCVGAKDAGIPLEVNLLGLSENRHYPRRDFWKIAKEVGNEVILGCDAHSPQRVAAPAELTKAKAYLEECGLSVIEHPKLIKPTL